MMNTQRLTKHTFLQTSVPSGLVKLALTFAAVVLVSAPLSAATLSVNGTALPGVDISNASFSGGDLNLVLSSGSSELEPVATNLPDVSGPSTEDLCGDAGQMVACVSDLGLLQDRVTSDSLELSGGVAASSAFFVSDNVDPNLVVLEFRGTSSMLPTITGSISTTPGGAALDANCSFVVSGYVGGRVYLSHDASSTDFQNRFCTVTRGERYFLNLTLDTSTAAGPLTVFRTVKLAGI